MELKDRLRAIRYQSEAIIAAGERQRPTDDFLRDAEDFIACAGALLDLWIHEVGELRICYLRSLTWYGLALAQMVYHVTKQLFVRGDHFIFSQRH